MIGSTTRACWLFGLILGDQFPEISYLSPVTLVAHNGLLATLSTNYAG